MNWGRILQAATKQLAKQETLYNLSTGVNVMLTIEGIGSSARAADSPIKRFAYAPPNTSILTGHELQKNNRVYIVAEKIEEYGFGVLLHNKLALIEAQYVCVADQITRGYTDQAGHIDTAVTIYSSMYFALMSTMLGDVVPLSMPLDIFVIIVSTRYILFPGYRLFFDDKYYFITDIDRMAAGTNRIGLEAEGRKT